MSAPRLTDLELPEKFSTAPSVRGLSSACRRSAHRGMCACTAAGMWSDHCDGMKS